MAAQLLTFIFVGLAIMSLLYITLILIFANLYDIKAIHRSKKQKKHPYSKFYRYRPLVKILIAAHNEELVIERCLSSIIRSSYRKYQVVVIDDGSSDKTSQIVKQLIEDHPLKNIKLIKKRKNVGKGEALNNGLKRYPEGEIIMTLDADCVVDKHAIKNAVRYFADEKIAALASNVRILPSYTLIGILQKFDYLIGFRSKKLNSDVNCEYIIGGAGAFYRKQIFSKVKRYLRSMQTEDIAISLAITKMGNKNNRLFYGSNVVVYTEPALTYKGLLQQRYRWKLGAFQAIYLNRKIIFSTSSRYTKMLSWFRLPLTLWGEFQLILEPLLITVIFYLAIVNRNPAFYTGACAIIMLVLLFAIWGDEYFSFKEKIKLSMLTPALYPLFYAMTVIQVIAIFRCLFNYKDITRQSEVGGKWISPARLGLSPSARTE